MHWPKLKTYILPALLWRAFFGVLMAAIDFTPQMLAHTKPDLGLPLTTANVSGRFFIEWENGNSKWDPIGRCPTDQTLAFTLEVESNHGHSRAQPQCAVFLLRADSGGFANGMIGPEGLEASCAIYTFGGSANDACPKRYFHPVDVRTYVSLNQRRLSIGRPFRDPLMWSKAVTMPMSP